MDRLNIRKVPPVSERTHGYCKRSFCGPANASPLFTRYNSIGIVHDINVSPVIPNKLEMIVSLPKSTFGGQGRVSSCHISNALLHTFSEGPLRCVILPQHTAHTDKADNQPENHNRERKAQSKHLSYQSDQRLEDARTGGILIFPANLVTSSDHGIDSFNITS